MCDDDVRSGILRLDITSLSNTYLWHITYQRGPLCSVSAYACSCAIKDSTTSSIQKTGKYTLIMLRVCYGIMDS